MDRSELTIVEDQGLYTNSCGYCKSQGSTSFAYGLWAHSLSPYDYQELLDQSWRRSGMILYRPELQKSCCPAYTIRLKAECMENSIENARAMRRMQRYLDGIYTSPSSRRKEYLAEEAIDTDVKPQCETHNTSMDTDLSQYQTKAGKWNDGKQKLAERDLTADMLCTKVRHAIKECILHGELPDNFEASKVVVQRLHKGPPGRGRKLMNGDVSYTCSVAFACAAALLRQKSECKILNSVSSKMEGKTTHRQVAVALADTIAWRLQTSEKMESLKVQACNGHLNFIAAHLDPSNKTTSSATSNSSHCPIDPNFKKSIDKSTLRKTSLPVEVQSLVKHKMEIRTTNSVFDPEEFSLYKRYQVAIHNEKPEDVTEVSFRRFLVDTPLTFVPPKEGGPFWGFGSFHQQYLIDGRLVAVGVIDILPSCLSSNYFFWDPDFAFLSLGRYSALKEIELIQEAKKYCETLEYYYLGHYIHSCPKMHYKVTFRPSELLCPIRFQWVPFDLARPLLDKQPFVCLSDSLQATHKQDREEETTRLIADTAKSRGTTELHCNEGESGGGSEVIMQGSEAADNIVNEDEMNNVLLKFEDNFLRFEQLRRWLIPSDESLDELISKLQNYIQLVGASLAARMAYVLV